MSPLPRVPRAFMAVLLLAALCLLAAIALIDVRFQARKLQAELSALELERRDLREQNRRFQIELASFTDYFMLHRRATDEQEMFFPDVADGSLTSLDELPGLARSWQLQEQKQQ